MRSWLKRKKKGKVLSSYDYVDKMPDILVRNSTQDTLEDMLATLKEFKQCLRKE